MGFFDRMAEAVFADQEDGSTLYYPCGMLGYGRIITCEKRKKEVFKAHRKSIIIGLFVGFLLGLSPLLLIQLGFSVVFAYSVIAVACITVCSIQLYLNKARVADLPKTDVKLNFASAHAKSVRSLPLIFWKFSLVLGLGLIPLYVTIRVCFPDHLDSHTKSTKYVIFLVVLSLLLTCQGWYGFRSYKMEEPTLVFRETNELEDINCEGEKEEIEELIIKEQQPEPSDKLDSV